MISWEYVENLLEQKLDSTFKKNYILCKNPADIFRWRILFQENLQRPLLGVEFCPLSLLYQKTVERFTGENIASPYSFLTSLLIQTFLQKKNPNLAFKRGIRTDLAEIIDILKWRQLSIDTILPFIKTDSQKKVKMILVQIFNFFNKNESKFEGEYLESMIWDNLTNGYTIKPDEEVNILWLYPAEPDFTEEKKLHLIESLLKPSWHIFALKNGMATNPNIFFPRLKKKKIHELETYKQLHYQSAESFLKQNKQISLSQTGRDKSERGSFLKIWSADSFYSESQLIADRIYELIHLDNISPINIHILCKDMQQSPTLVQALQERDISTDVRVAQNSAVMQFVSTFISVLGLDEESSLLKVDTLFSFLTNPLCNLKYLSGKNDISYTSGPFYWKKIVSQHFLPKEISLENLLEYLKVLKDNTPPKTGSLHNKKEKELHRLGFRHLQKALKALIDIKNAIHQASSVREAVVKFYEEFLRVIIVPDQGVFHIKKVDNEKNRSFFKKIQSQYKKECERMIETIQRHCFEFLNLFDTSGGMGEKVFERISLTDFFYILKEYLKKSEHSKKDTQNFSYYSSFYSSAEDEDGPSSGITIRPMEEGIYSYCEYLFISGLHDNEPSRETENVFFKENSIPKEYSIQKSKVEIQREWLLAFSMVSKGIILTLIQNSEKSIHHLVFDILDMRVDAYLGSEELFEKIPLFSKLPIGSGLWANAFDIPRLSGQAETHDFQFLPEKVFDSKERKNDLKHSIKVYENKVYDQRVNAFTGDVSSHAPLLDLNNSISYSDFRLLASCPQSYWFKKSLGITGPVIDRYLYESENSERGIWFHAASRLFMEALIKKYPMMSYHQISQKESLESLSSLLKDLFQETTKELTKSLSLLKSFFLENDLKTQEEMFIYYFTSFLGKASEKTHVLSEYIPLFVELAFEDIVINSFKFKGVIDRVDYSPKENILLVCDYKTGKASKGKDILKNIFDLKDIQLPIYMEAALKSDKIYDKIKIFHQASKVKIKGYYIYVKESMEAKKNELIPDDLEYGSEKDFYDNLIQPLKGHMDVIKEVVQRGYVFAVPHREKNLKERKEMEPCIYCSFRGICDREPFDAALGRLHSDKILSFYLGKFES